ncbi:MAG TPA: D-arabinono-1,4-lactone oxidase [Adhaeribacter sp.]|nr:D-arabinono-1,4-lactone oxidase [Adhaeribacter sp.]
MTHEWKNWSGSLKFTPNEILNPKTEEQLADAIGQAARQNRKVRVFGAGHSSSELFLTDDLLVSVNELQGLISHDESKKEATIYAGMKVKQAGTALQEVGLAMHNTGDVDVQNLSGAIGTGTHGTGKKLPNLSAMLLGARLITASGQIIEKHIEDDPEFIKALRVSLGTLGIFTRLRLGLQPAFKLIRQEWCTHIETCLQHLDQLENENRNMDFYWYPRSDMAKFRTMNEESEGKRNYDFAKCVMHEEGWSNEILPRSRHLKFDEMEYALPAEAGPDCFKEVRKRVKAKHRAQVAWRVLYRTIAADETFISPYFGRESVTISLHHNAGLPFKEYFNDIEPIFQAHGGRPHWGKKHNMKAAQLQPLYPKWNDFMQIRKKMDPDGIFMTPYMQELLGA